MRPALLALALLACAPRQPTDPTAEVQALLVRSAAAWNRGDLDAFVSDYAADSTTTFVSGGRAQHGFAWIREHYGPSFAPGVPHDSLRFEEWAVRPLGADYALATARFVLFRGDSTTSSGPFTLVLRRERRDWKIIHDHTSSDTH